jgi:hypothetical protein
MALLRALLPYVLDLFSALVVFCEAAHAEILATCIHFPARFALSHLIADITSLLIIDKHLVVAVLPLKEVNHPRCVHVARCPNNVQIHHTQPAAERPTSTESTWIILLTEIHLQTSCIMGYIPSRAADGMYRHFQRQRLVFVLFSELAGSEAYKSFAALITIISVFPGAFTSKFKMSFTKFLERRAKEYA